MKILSILSLCFFSLVLQAQSNSNVYLFTFIKNGDKLEIKDAENLSAFNNEGLNQDPTFYDDHTIYLSSDYFDNNVEILKLDLLANTVTRLTKTPEKEFRTTILKNRKEFSVIKTTGSIKSMHRYPLNLKEKGFPMYANAEKVTGYTYDFNGGTFVSMQQGLQSNMLGFLLSNEDEPSILFENTGKHIEMDKYGNLIFIHKMTETKSMFKILDTKTQKAKIIHSAMADSDVFEYLSNNELISCKGSKLFKLNIKNNLGWQEIADLSDYGISKIKDLIIRKNKLVVVE